MSDQAECTKIMEMDAVALLKYIATHPFYMTDSYYSRFGETIRNRIAGVAAAPSPALEPTGGGK